MQKFNFSIILSLFFLSAYSQGEKIMDETVYEEWTRIKGQALTPDGNHVVYNTERIKNDPSVIIHDRINGTDYSFAPAKQFKITHDGSHVLFLKTNEADSVRHWKRTKKSKDDYPNDTLFIVRLSDKNIAKIADISKITLPTKWSGYAACIQDVPADSLVKES